MEIAAIFRRMQLGLALGLDCMHGLDHVVVDVVLPHYSSVLLEVLLPVEPVRAPSEGNLDAGRTRGLGENFTLRQGKVNERSTCMGTKIN